MQNENMISFRKSNFDDLNSIEELFGEAIKEMNRNDIPQWDEIYPDLEVLKEDMLKQELYVGVINHFICSAFVLNQEMDEQYSNGKWEYPISRFCIIHRLCVNPIFQNQGIGTKTMKYIEKILKEQGVETIRLDAFSLNPYALNMYSALGYNIVGEAHWRKGMFFLMEKKL